MLILIVGLILFLGVHSVRMVAPGWRDRVIETRGETVWKGLYAAVSLVGLIALIWGYGQARAGAPVLYFPPTWLSHITLVLMWPSLILLFASQLPAGYMKKAVKHPQLLAVKLWAFGHLLANGDLASLLLFCGFLGWAIWNRISVKRRGNPVFETVTVRSDVIATVIGTAVYVWFVVQGHAWLFGVSPVG